MARQYQKVDAQTEYTRQRHNAAVLSVAICLACALVSVLPLTGSLSPWSLVFFAGLIPLGVLTSFAALHSRHKWLERERIKESERRAGRPVLGSPPDRTAFERALADARHNGKVMIDRYLVGFEVDNGKPIWVTDEELCGHGAVFAKTGVGKTLWLEGLMIQQMARGRASGFTFIDAKRDPGTLADIIMMALLTGRIEDVVVVDPFDPVCAYNFVFTTQRADVKARKVLRCGLPPTSDQSTTKHYDRLAADAVYRAVRAMESLGLAWSVRDIAVALSAFTVAYPRLRQLLHEHGSKQAMVELGHLAGSYRTAKGGLDTARLTDNLRGISSELHSISNSEAGEMFCAPRADLSLTDAILRGKLIYYMLPRLEEAESAARMVKVFREDLEVSIGEITSSRVFKLEDPHMVIIDEGASTFGPTWANLFELARKGRFALLFGAQSVGGLMDSAMGLSEEFYERVMANVNLKVIMRLGDNRTAMDMSEWIGKITKEKKSISTAVSTGVAAHELTKSVELNRRSSDSFREGITVSEDEEDLVSPEELKHEMSAEKGLAWFDKGDGILRKGRSIWFDAELPPTWEGREFLARYESVEGDEVGLAEWVDEHIFSVEQAETERAIQHAGENPAAPGTSGGPSAAGGSGPGSAPPETKEEDDGPFRLNPRMSFRGRVRPRLPIERLYQPPQKSTPPDPPPLAAAPDPAPDPAPAKEPPPVPDTPPAPRVEQVPATPVVQAPASPAAQAPAPPEKKAADTRAENRPTPQQADRPAPSGKNPHHKPENRPAPKGNRGGNPQKKLNLRGDKKTNVPPPKKAGG